MDSPDIATPQRQEAQDSQHQHSDPPPQGSTSRNRVIGHSPRILSLDGGGIRGLSALLILRDILNAVRRKSGNRSHLPCELFDLIGGTSTGGLIAIMLGRLGMVTAQKTSVLWPR
jgi:Patatin-like phospholipase